MNKNLIKSDFNFFVPIDITKSKDRKGNEVMRVKGIASTPDLDSEDEVLLPIGFDLSRFLSSGYINWNHQGKSSPDKIIGEPDVAKITNDGSLYIEGILYPESDLAKSVWKLGETLKKNSSGRRLGWSIEGKSLERDPINPKRITKALITGVAITPSPVNTNTYLDLVKGEQKEDFVNYEFEEDIELHKLEKGEFLYEFNVGDKVYGITKSFDCVEKKSIVPDIEKEESESQKKIKKVMSEFKSGTLKDSHGNKVTDRDQALAIAMSEAGISKEKAMDTTSTAPLIPESLDPKHKEVLKKAIVNGILPLQNLIQKGGRRATLGEIREWKGQKYRKTLQGWEPVTEGKSKVKQKEESKEKFSIWDEAKKIKSKLMEAKGDNFEEEAFKLFQQNKHKDDKFSTPIKFMRYAWGEAYKNNETIIYIKERLKGISSEESSKITSKKQDKANKDADRRYKNMFPRY